jgi:hypothetical protein
VVFFDNGCIVSDTGFMDWFSRSARTARIELHSVLLWVLLSQYALVGCGVVKPDPEERVKSRAEGYWGAILSEDYEAAYGYLAPGFRLKITEPVYRGRFAGLMEYHDAVVQRVACEGDRCEVSVDTEYTFLGLPGFAFKVRERKVNEQLWVYSEDDWWLLPAK